MATLSTPQGTTHRKLIDIPEDVFRTLSIKASTLGLNLKKYIENLLIEDANEMEDAELYRYLIAKYPEGKVKLTETEQEDFMKRNGIGKYR